MTATPQYRSYATPMAREGVSSPSQLSKEGMEAHYKNKSHVRWTQAETRRAQGNRSVNADGSPNRYHGYRPRFMRASHDTQMKQ